MKIDTQAEAIEIMYSIIPYSNQIRDLDLTVPDALYFTWRGYEYKLDLDHCSAWKVDGRLLVGDSASLLIGEMIKNEAIRRYMEKGG